MSMINDYINQRSTRDPEFKAGIAQEELNHQVALTVRKLRDVST